MPEVLTFQETKKNVFDILDKAPDVLPNKIWTLRVLQIAKLLKIGMAHPLDSANGTNKLKGAWAGSHVELKLAVFGVFLLMQQFNTVNGLRGVTLKSLKSLRKARWNNGRRPALEIYFSRKNCRRCTRMNADDEEDLKVLSASIGVDLRFIVGWTP